MPSQAKRTVKLLIADDHEMLREGFHTMLKKHHEIQLVGEAENGVELLEMTEKLHPDVIITDIKMPKMDGVEATKIITKKYPEISVIAFTMFEEESLIVDMLEAGAHGYLVKSAAKSEILDAIDAVMEQKTYYCRHTTARLAEVIAKSKFHPRRKFPRPAFGKRELEIMRMICDQFSNKEMAISLHLSTRTIEGYRERMQEKMNVRNTAGIVVFAIRNGYYKI